MNEETEAILKMIDKKLEYNKEIKALLIDVHSGPEVNKHILEMVFRLMDSDFRHLREWITQEFRDKADSHS